LLGHSSGEHKNEFDFGDFFHLDSIAVEHEGFNVISSEDFLRKLGKTGKLMNINTGKPEIWNEGVPHTSANMNSYLLKVGVNPHWSPTVCAAAFPSGRGERAVEELRRAHEHMMSKNRSTLEEFVGNPVPVDAPMGERIREMLADRDELCIYDERLQNAHVVHFPAQKDTRLLTHFYAFVFFADWRADLWSKRFVRDHLRYIDEIMCAAARIVQAVRERSHNENKTFDTMHVRRGGEHVAVRQKRPLHLPDGLIRDMDRDKTHFFVPRSTRADFQYKKTRLDAYELIERSQKKLEEGGLIYIATDERDKTFFDPFKKYYDIVFLDDFKHVLKGVNENYYGMLDQLVASKGRVFYGTFFSTLSGYVNRMRGYYIAKHKLDGYQDGTMESYYFHPVRNKISLFPNVRCFQLTIANLVHPDDLSSEFFVNNTG
jgi:hypothetical protein